MIDKKKIKEKLTKERDLLLEEMKGMGKFDTKTGEWETIPEDFDYEEFDQNDMADRFEDFESRSSMMKVLKERLKNVLDALKNLSKSSFGLCKVCKKEIESARLTANPAAETCKKHLES